MKRKYKLTKDEIIELFVSGCDKCGAREDCIAENCEINCITMKEEWLNKDIEMKPRIALINTIEELEKAKKEFKCICSSNKCMECKYNGLITFDCFCVWLKEEVEV